MPDLEVLQALARIDTKLDAFREETRAEIAKISERVVILEQFKGQYDSMTERFWNLQWPGQERYIASIDDRVHSLERDQIHSARLSDIEKAVTEATTQIKLIQQNTNTIKTLQEENEVIKANHTKLNDQVVAMKTLMKVFTAVAAFLGSISGGVLVKLLHW